MLTESAKVDAALAEFDSLFKLILKDEEATLPDLEGEFDSFIDELEKMQGTIQRDQFKAYLMIPITRKNPGAKF